MSLEQMDGIFNQPFYKMRHPPPPQELRKKSDVETPDDDAEVKEPSVHVERTV